MGNDEKCEAVRDYARHTTGSEQVHRNWTKSLVYTDGIKFLADTCEAHWLIDLVASHQTGIRRALARLRKRDFQVWRLAGWKIPGGEKAGEQWGPDDHDDAVITAWEDTPYESRMLVRQSIPVTDFPDDLMPFEFWVENGTMLLKEER